MAESGQQDFQNTNLTKEIYARYLDSTILCMKYFERANIYIEKQTAESFTPFRYI